MDTELFGMLFTFHGDRDRLYDNHCGTLSGDLPVKLELSFRHRAVGIAIGKLNGWKHEPVHQLGSAKFESFEHPFHEQLLSLMNDRWKKLLIRMG
jgi:hypothetical protein